MKVKRIYMGQDQLSRSLPISPPNLLTTAVILLMPMKVHSIQELIISNLKQTKMRLAEAKGVQENQFFDDDEILNQLMVAFCRPGKTTIVYLWNVSSLCRHQ